MEVFMRVRSLFFRTFLVLILAGSFLNFPPAASGQVIEEHILKNLTYRSIGPTRQSGRFVDFAVPLQQPYTFYAATASGGLWKTVNNGQTFDVLFEQNNVFSIGDIAVSPVDPNVIWLGS